MFYKKNIDFVALLWEDYMFQADNSDISYARKENMPYPRFTKVIIYHFISKDKTISMRNKINVHTIRDDSLLGTLKYVSKTKDYQKYEALIHEQMMNQAIQDSKEYKIYLAFATREATPKKARRFKKILSPSKKQTLVLEDEPAKKPKQAKHPKPAKEREKGTQSHQASGLDDGVGSQPKTLDIMDTYNDDVSTPLHLTYEFSIRKWFANRLPEAGTGTRHTLGFGNGTVIFGQEKTGTTKTVSVRYHFGTVHIPSNNDDSDDDNNDDSDNDG
nr:hypothetical protein [Tanacetum cinerariifolium]